MKVWTARTGLGSCAIALLTVFVPICLMQAVPSAFAADRITGKNFATRSEVIARHGMAATSQPLATQIALDILKGGATPWTRPSPPTPLSA